MNKEIVLVTKHGKERAVRRPFWIGLGMQTVCKTDFDTDLLGTFSGEIERADSPLNTCIRKASVGLEAGCSSALANEGSFGPHPYLPFVAADFEMMAYVDCEGNRVVEQLLAYRTNYGHLDLKSKLEEVELQAWLERVRFPSHALILKVLSGDEIVFLEKGINSASQLRNSLALAARQRGQLRLETDMRAHCNPTRMGVIGRLAVKLVRRLLCQCPSCLAPGFGLEGQQPGLPCSLCGNATDLALFEIFACPRCGKEERRPRADGLKKASPGDCQFCNP
ncbi:MAG: hypothetical protein K2Y32_05965 [Candidatus Obscuribacterales bacterium]|nr:hypothetical protein [Candidatus Obscuribacterales bacterium]